MTWKPEDIKKKLQERIAPERLIEDCSMSGFSSFACGGRAALLAEPSNEEELFYALEVLREADIPYMALGCGTNVLFSDSGYDGVVLRIGRGFSDINLFECGPSDEGELFRAIAGAGARLSKLAILAAERGCKGFEFACGIPGSVGGAVLMNAGAYGGEIKDYICSVRALGPDGSVRVYKKEEMELSYRRSIFTDSGEIILSAEFELVPGDPEEISALISELGKKRAASQPLQYPSAGSFFKRPEGHYAGKLIEEAGLKGLRIGGAMVSPLHAGFIINAGGASASDVIDLMNVVRETVADRFGVLLEPEVRIIG